MIHLSTDYVFDGTKSEPYTEDDPPRPINVYGRSKLPGELAIQAAGAPYMIFRTNWVYGLREGNLLLTILRLAKERDELRIVGDQIGAPTWSRTYAEVSALALARGRAMGIEQFNGIYHLTAGGGDFLVWLCASDCSIRVILAVMKPTPAFDHFLHWFQCRATT